MLFNSYTFLFVFLPVTLIGYQVAGRFHRKAVVAWLGLMSLAFYAYWRPTLLYILVLSIALNYLAAALISHQIPNRIAPRVWLIAAIMLDLAALGFFKYLFPSLNFFSSAAGSPYRWADVVLPLGISFFTFTQIAFLVDLYQGIATQQDIFSYVLFVTFFPHLIAGPILHHKDMMPQFQQARRYALDRSDLSVGFTWFIMGAAKKVLLADSFARMADPVFNAHELLAPSTAWIGATAYSLQLYFDFSGYSDMALGLARMFSINFPLNFNSPFKSTSIIDFWQRWHITLSQYVMSYVYTPIQRIARAHRQGKGKGVSRKDMATPGAFTSIIALPMMFTLFIAGVWHGAGLQFMIYGLLHGFYLVVNHGWRLFTHKRVPDPEPILLVVYARRASSVLVTFLCVMVSFVFFRALSAGQAFSILSAMSGFHRAGRFTLPNSVASCSMKIALGLAFVWLLPNTQQILSRYKPSLDQTVWEPKDSRRSLRWSPSIPWAVLCGTILLAVVSMMEHPSAFLYFQF